MVVEEKEEEEEEEEASVDEVVCACTGFVCSTKNRLYHKEGVGSSNCVLKPTVKRSDKLKNSQILKYPQSEEFLELFALQNAHCTMMMTAWRR